MVAGELTESLELLGVRRRAALGLSLGLRGHGAHDRPSSRQAHGVGDGLFRSIGRRAFRAVRDHVHDDDVRHRRLLLHYRSVRRDRLGRLGKSQLRSRPMPPERNEQERRKLIRELEEQNQRLQAELQDFEANISKRQRRNEDQIRRLEADFPPGDICGQCWIAEGARIPMVNIPEQPVQPMRDRFMCPRCLREEIREA